MTEINYCTSPAFSNKILFCFLHLSSIWLALRSYANIVQGDCKVQLCPVIIIIRFLMISDETKASDDSSNDGHLSSGDNLSISDENASSASHGLPSKPFSFREMFHVTGSSIRICQTGQLVAASCYSDEHLSGC